MSKKVILISFLMLGILLSACKGEVAQTSTMDPAQMETQVAEQVASEVAAQLTQIALNQPTNTATLIPTVPIIDTPSSTATSEPPSPTDTPALVENTPTSSPTSVPSNPTNTAPSVTQTRIPTSTTTPAPFACQIVKQSPENGKVFKPNTDFDAVWTVKNVGTTVWDNNEVDYRYESGDEIHKHEGYDLPKNVKPGESIDLTVDMQAPDEDGNYKTTWVLHRGGHLLCTLTLEIKVEK